MHKEHMKRCIELAKIAEGKTSPILWWGAVVVDENGKVIAEGYHKKSGELMQRLTH
jgi:diaminohydroxyphosphoribosylaminopyrimidine deaminase/5-amino-6-(5-phosphoribosylamino)uracil reductase